MGGLEEREGMVRRVRRFLVQAFYQCVAEQTRLFLSDRIENPAERFPPPFNHVHQLDHSQRPPNNERRNPTFRNLSTQTPTSLALILHSFSLLILT